VKDSLGSADDRAAAPADTKRGDGGAGLRGHLKALHEEAAGFTEACASACVDRHGRNSYAWISEAVTPPPGGSVLDLACGSGVLLELCRARYEASVALTGLDVSAAELRLAHERLTDAEITLHEGVAQSLDFAADDSFDAVLCHWALTLMDPLEPVLAEIARVLRPGGVFSAIVDGPGEAAPGYVQVADLIADHVRRASPERAELGDPRARDGAALAGLARDSFPGADVAIETEVFSIEGEPASLARLAADFFYSAYTLAPPERALMLADLTAQFARMERPRYEMPVNRLRVALPR